MKTTIAILIACLTLFIIGCGEAQESASFTPAEQEILTFIAGHVEQMDGLIVDTNAVLTSDAGAGAIAKMDRIATSYDSLVNAYHATNGGENAGGRVTRLEQLWVDCADNIQFVAQSILQCYIDPESVDVDRAAEALVLAEQGIEDIRAELEALTGQTY